MPEDSNLQQQETKHLLIKHLKGGEAFMPVKKILEEMEIDKLGIRPGELPYSFYEIFYHMWFTQRDIVDYCTKANYSPHEWPKDYWPNKTASENEEEWNSLKTSFFEDREKLILIIQDSRNSILTPVPGNEEHSILREILLVIEHSAYHTGQLLILLRQLGLHSS